MAQVGVATKMRDIEGMDRPHLGDLAKHVETRSQNEKDTCSNLEKPFLKKWPKVI